MKLLYTTYNEEYKIYNIAYKFAFTGSDKFGFLIYVENNFPLKRDEDMFYNLFCEKLDKKKKGYEHEYFSTI